MRCIANDRQQAPKGCSPCPASSRVCCCYPRWKPKRETRVTRVEYSEIRFSGFWLWLAGRVFPPQRQATIKVSVGIFVRFPLASSAGRSINTTCPHTRQPPRFAEKRVSQLAVSAARFVLILDCPSRGRLAVSDALFIMVLPNPITISPNKHTNAHPTSCLTLHRALRRMAGLVFLLVFWVLAGACQRHGVGGFLL